MSAGLAPTPAAPPPLGLLPRGSGPSPGGAAPQPPFLLRSPASDDLNSCDVSGLDTAMPDAAPYVSVIAAEFQKRGLRIDTGASLSGQKRRASRERAARPATPRAALEPESPTLAFARGLAAAARKRQTLSLAADHRAAPPRLRAPPRPPPPQPLLRRSDAALGDAKHRLAASPARRDLPRQPPSPPVQDRARPPPRGPRRGRVPASTTPGRAPLSPPSPSASRSCPASPTASPTKDASPAGGVSRFAKPFGAAAKDLRSLRLRRFFDLENSGLAEPHSACGSEPLPKKAHSVDHSNAIERRPLPKKSKSCPLLLDIANMDAAPQPPHWTLRALAIAS
ncbi:hypothetical protein JL721_8570 [Aureococcus anophagefferens]|nr:hypothetical protein JL721_8570 [Aureococcus anophagefferens]